MCGIIAYLGSSNKVNTILTQGLSILQNRGYDSVGITIVSKDAPPIIHKFCSVKSTSDSMEQLALKLGEEPQETTRSEDVIGIGHTRWATHGSKTIENTHPHTDQKNRVYLVHNGIIENYLELRRFLQGQGPVATHVHFNSETDSEVIAQYAGWLLDERRVPNLEEAIKECTRVMKGTWGIAAVDRNDPDTLVLAAYKSPMLVGFPSDGGNGVFVASEIAAVSKHVSTCAVLKDGQVIAFHRGQQQQQLGIKRVPVNHESILLDPSPWAHWTLREIEEQPQSISRLLCHHHSQVPDLSNTTHLLFTGCGTSLHAARYGAHLMRKSGLFSTIQVVDASELDEFYFCPDMTLIALSQSGETHDVIKAVLCAQKHHVPVIAVVNQPGSKLTRLVATVFHLHAGRENAVASTKAFSAQVVLLTLWAKHLNGGGGGGGSGVNLSDLPNALSTVLGSDLQCVVRLMTNVNHCFLLGKGGAAEAVALEGALKIKEISYIHAEGCAAGSLKHGPFALIEQGTVILAMVFDDEHQNGMLSCIQEVHARGASVVVISNVENVADQCPTLAAPIIFVPKHPMSYLLANVVFQRLAYNLAISRGINPDKPRNLAKTVTVA